MADYISQEAMHKANQDEWQGVYGFVDCDIFEDNENMIDRVPSADVLSRWERERNGETDVGRVLPSGYMWYRGDGVHNHFRDAYKGGTAWDWTLESPYES